VAAVTRGHRIALKSAAELDFGACLRERRLDLT
jgi:hypothetical protein